MQRLPGEALGSPVALPHDCATCIKTSKKQSSYTDSISRHEQQSILVP